MFLTSRALRCCSLLCSVNLYPARSPMGSPCPPRCPAVSAALARTQAHPDATVLVTVPNMTIMAECDMAVAEIWNDYAWDMLEYEMKINASTQHAISKHALNIQQYSVPTVKYHCCYPSHRLICSSTRMLGHDLRCHVNASRPGNFKLSQWRIEDPAVLVLLQLFFEVCLFFKALTHFFLQAGTFLHLKNLCCIYQ